MPKIAPCPYPITTDNSGRPGGRWRFEKPPQGDPSYDPDNWTRTSKVKSYRKINQKNAKEQYHITVDDIGKAGVRHDTSYFSLDLKPGWGKEYSYNEREIEEIAWKKYGGPQGFDRFLHESWLHHAGPKAFCYPAGYKHAVTTGNFQAPPKPKAPRKSKTSKVPKDEPVDYGMGNATTVAPVPVAIPKIEPKLES